MWTWKRLRYEFEVERSLFLNGHDICLEKSSLEIAELRR
jgi:hypothetical protein